MLWVRGLIFTALVPAVIGGLVPWLLEPHPSREGGVWDAGWVLIAVGSFMYFLCLLRFLAAGGTPAIFFTKPLRALLGEEPGGLVSQGLYRFSRNPMYVGVVMAVFGQAMVFASSVRGIYGVMLFLMFHIVVGLEEPHLRRTRGASYETYCRTVPRWLGWPHGS